MTENIDLRAVPIPTRHCKDCSKRLAAMNRDIRCFTCIYRAQKRVVDTMNSLAHFLDETSAALNRTSHKAAAPNLEWPVKAVVTARSEQTFGITSELFKLVSSLRIQNS